MKITALTAESYRFPQQRPIRTGDGTFGVTRMSLIRVATDSGLNGIGWLYTSRLAASEKIIPQLVEGFQSTVQGRDPCDTEAIWAALHAATAAGERGLIASIIGAIDIALWDVKGQAANLPLYKLLGGYAGRIPAYNAGGYYEAGKGLRELAHEMESYVALGARAVKMKIGGAPVKEDVERVRAVRNAVGPDIKVLVA